MTGKISCDVFIIGGGINGCGLARDLAGRGYSVTLAEMNDLASGTSSWSTKLIHGGLRYLEHYEFRLVREALYERELLWSLAPHIISPMRFILPHHKGLRPAWLLRLGLFIYDHLGGRKRLPTTKTIDLGNAPHQGVLQPEFVKGFEYSDFRVDDARLVVLNAVDARKLGAKILPRHKVVGLRRESNLWSITLEDHTGLKTEHQAHLLVNAAGPWGDDILSLLAPAPTRKNLRLVQGSHIVVKKLYEHDRAYIFQQKDGRIVFAIPFERDFTLIGTTDLDYQGDPAKAAITEGETAYLLSAANGYFAKNISSSDICWAYAGVRSLYDDGATEAQEATRDYVLRLDSEAGAPPLLNIFGGKITTYRKLALAAAKKIEKALGRRGEPFTHERALPGGGFKIDAARDILAKLQKQYAFLDPIICERLFKAYGTSVGDVLKSASQLEDLGQHFGHGLYAAEVDYLIENEWAASTQDILYRRSKLGLYFTPPEVAALEVYMERKGMSQ